MPQAQFAIYRGWMDGWTSKLQIVRIPDNESCRPPFTGEIHEFDNLNEAIEGMGVQPGDRLIIQEKPLKD